MAKDDTRVRLPELPIFKKYSLALRQEFATPKELLGVLDRTASKVQTLIEKAEDAKQRQEPPVPPEPEPSVEEVLPEEIAEPQEVDGPAVEHEFDTEIELGESEEAEGVLRFLDKDEAVPDEDDSPFRPIWEPEPPATNPPVRKKTKRPAASHQSAKSKTARRTKSRSTTKASAAKGKSARPQIVLVSRRGTPIKSRSGSSSKKNKKG